MELASLHLGDQLCHGALRIPAQSVPVFGFLFVDVEQILLEDPPAEGGLHLLDTLPGEVALLGIGGEHHHVDMDAVLLAVEGGVPAQVLQRDLIPPGDLRRAGAHQLPPALRVVVAQPFRVLPADGHHRRPHTAGVLRHPPDGLGEIAYLAPGAPQAVLTVQLHAGAVGHVVQVVLHPAHGLREVLLHLANESVGVCLGGRVAVVFILQQFLRAGEVTEQVLDISLLLFRSGLVLLFTPEHLHTRTGGNVACSVGQLGCVPSALQVGGHEADAAHPSG